MTCKLTLDAHEVAIPAFGPRIFPDMDCFDLTWYLSGYACPGLDGFENEFPATVGTNSAVQSEFLPGGVSIQPLRCLVTSPNKRALIMASSKHTTPRPLRRNAHQKAFLFSHLNKIIFLFLARPSILYVRPTDRNLILVIWYGPTNSRPKGGECCDASAIVDTTGVHTPNDPQDLFEALLSDNVTIDDILASADKELGGVQCDRHFPIRPDNVATYPSADVPIPLANSTDTITSYQSLFCPHVEDRDAPSFEQNKVTVFDSSRPNDQALPQCVASPFSFSTRSSSDQGTIQSSLPYQCPNCKRSFAHRWQLK